MVVSDANTIFLFTHILLYVNFFNFHGQQNNGNLSQTFHLPVHSSFDHGLLDTTARQNMLPFFSGQSISEKVLLLHYEDM